MCSFHVKPVFQGYIYKHFPTFAPNMLFEVCVKVECTKNVNIGQLYLKTNSQIKKSGLWLPEAGIREGELDEGSQKEQLPVIR